MDFYDHIAPGYDQMTNLDSRLTDIRDFIQRLQQRYQPTSALDVACGTGAHAVTMAQMAIRSVGADLSPAMLDKARTLAQKTGVQVSWLNSPMQELSQHLDEQFDLVLCLGNSLPHLLTPEDLDATLSGFAKLLQPRGVILLQLLNYHKILKNQERIVAITRKGPNEYIRFYDFLPQLIRFNLLTVPWQDNQAQPTLISTLLFPHTADTLTPALKRHNFTTIKTYADLNFNPFDPDTSPNLIIEARL